MQWAMRAAALGVALLAVLATGANLAGSFRRDNEIPKSGRFAERLQTLAEEMSRPAPRSAPESDMPQRFKESGVIAKVLMGSNRHRRPTWGRDFGPIDEMKGSGGLKEEPKYQGRETQEHADLDPGDPFSKPLAETLLPKEETDDVQVTEPVYEMEEPNDAPEAEEHYSETDSMDQAEAVEGAVADNLVSSDGGLPDPESFTGISCEESCTKCYLTVLEVGSSTCECFANCKKGIDATICDVFSAGWKDNAQSIPNEEWIGSCNAGDRNCKKECIKKETMEKAEACRKGNYAKACLVDMLENYEPPPKSPSDRVMFCATKHMPTCEKLTEHPPNYKDGKGPDGWKCFSGETAEKDCFDYLNPAEKKIDDDHDPVSVFESVQQR
eukprot:gnl/TRDRNA2_/TRDRNA2_179923_c0_seq1.p1 gnl/TRDRNA2_/TRDRNA2_179923_c0~~gnl/TRDRNA2_/TRDRNA2_179923_c0_seq1.p1  ORF type:complete len:383 (-),score=76.04 gnl/TRDRNA2_/TRDRNA2_179923_c0_seq1:135-1283(-)